MKQRKVDIRVPSWLIWILAAIILWGLWGAFTAQATKHHDALGVVAGAVIIEGLVMLPFASKAWTARSWPLLAVSLFGLAAYACFFQAVKAAGSSSVVVAMGATYPIVTYVIALLFLHETLNWKAALGIALAVSGTFLLSSASSIAH